MNKLAAQLMEIVREDEEQEELEQLIERLKKDEKLDLMLGKALEKDNYELADLLLKSGAQFDKSIILTIGLKKLMKLKFEISQDNHRYDMLMRWIAAYGGYEEIDNIFDECFVKDISSNEKSKLSKSKLARFKADVFRNYLRKMALFLVEEGADITVENNHLLKWASANGFVEIVQFLIDSGIDVTIEDNYAIRYAAFYGEFETAKLLIDAGADVTANSNEAIKFASSQKKFWKDETYDDVIKLLIEAGADESVIK